MQAIQTTFISPTDTLGPRIKVSAGGESILTGSVADSNW